MREAVFSSLGPVINQARALDLFAGSGSYGLEALSRGAASCVFVEKHPHAVAALQVNLVQVLKSLGNPDDIKTKIIRRDVLRFESTLKFDCIFMDPPYDLIRSHGDELRALAGNLLSRDGVLVYEMPGDLQLPGNGWILKKRIGKSGINEPSVGILQIAG